MAALEQSVEMRNVSEAGGKCDFRDRLGPMAVIQEISRAGHNPLVVDIFAGRATRAGEQLVHVSLRTMEPMRERRRA